MYSVVLLMAVSGGAEAVDFGRRGCNCSGWNCSGCYCSGYTARVGCHGCRGDCHGCRGARMYRGCAGCWGCSGGRVYGCHGCHGCNGCYRAAPPTRGAEPVPPPKESQTGESQTGARPTNASNPTNAANPTNVGSPPNSPRLIFGGPPAANGGETRRFMLRRLARTFASGT